VKGTQKTKLGWLAINIYCIYSGGDGIFIAQICQGHKCTISVQLNE